MKDTLLSDFTMPLNVVVFTALGISVGWHLGSSLVKLLVDAISSIIVGVRKK